MWNNVYTGKKVYKNYLINENGEIFNIKTKKLMKTRVKKNGYVEIGLTDNGKQKYFLIHRLVASTFILRNISKNQVNHEDGNKQNNVYDNLKWMNCKENMEHAWENNLYTSIGENNHNNKYPEEVIEKACHLIFIDKLKRGEIMKETGLPKHLIDDIRRFRSWERVSKKIISNGSTTIERDDDVYIDLEDDYFLPEVKLIFIAS